MGIVTANLAISLDGYAAGPAQSLEHAFGEGADALTAWMFERDQPGREADGELLSRIHAGTGAHVMGRNMFGPGRGAWDLSWTGWWGPEPPYHAPVFVLTNHPREPLELEGGTTFTFVTDGIESALTRPAPPPATVMSRSPVAPQPSGSTSPPASSTSSCCTWCRS